MQSGLCRHDGLAALCCSCYVVIARCLGFGCGLNFGRQAAWRPDLIGIVSSSRLAALCKQLLCSVIAIKSFDGKRGILLSSSCLAARLRSLGKSFESLCAFRAAANLFLTSEEDLEGTLQTGGVHGRLRFAGLVLV